MVSTDGRIQKTRLRVSEETNPYALNTTGLLVVGYYDYSLGMWQNFAGGSRVDKCYTLGGGFESQFMYKALVSMQWVYFDL